MVANENFCNNFCSKFFVAKNLWILEEFCEDFIEFVFLLDLPKSSKPKIIKMIC